MVPFRHSFSKPLLTLRALVLFFLTLTPQILAQHLTCPPFEVKNPEVSNHSMYAVAQGGGLIIAVGRGQIIVSADGGDTFTAANPGDYWFRDVLWTGTHFIACTNSGEVFSSENGLTWTLRIKVASTQFTTLASNGSIYVAAGWFKIATSPDGINWTEGPIVNGPFNELSWDGVFFKTVGSQMNHLISADGINWTITYLGINDEFSSMAYDGNTYVAAGEYQDLIYTSTSSTGWTARPLPGANAHSKKVSYVNGHFYLFTWRDNWRSVNGVTWEPIHFDAEVSQLNDVIWTGSRYLAFGFGNAMYESPDGVNWKLKNAFTSEYSEKVSWDGSHFVLLNRDDKLWKSPNGNQWQSVDLPPRPPEIYSWYDIAHSPTGHIIVGFSDTYLFSSNGVDWEQKTNGLGVSFATIDWLNHAWLAVGLDDGMIYQSLDGETWTGYNLNPNGQSFRYAHETTYHNGTYVAVGYATGSAGFIATSSNLVDWQYQIIDHVGRFYDVTWVGDRFLAGAQDGQVFQSATGDVWTPFPTDLERHVRKIIYNGRDTIIMDESGTLMRTEDPTGAWTLEQHPTIPYAKDMVMHEETIVVMGSGSALFTRECGLCYEADEVPIQIAEWTAVQDVAFLVGVINNPCAP